VTSIGERLHATSFFGTAEKFIGMGMRYAKGPLPTIAQLRHDYECSRATAYRYLEAIRTARGATYEPARELAA
jgi:hypothetical protein